MEDQEPSDSSASGMSNNACALSALSLPPCNSQHIGDFDGLLSNNMFTAAQREKMAGAIQKNGYIFLEVIR
jgi:hypothetical protein